jgi:hypothetical protein
MQAFVLVLRHSPTLAMIFIAGQASWYFLTKPNANPMLLLFAALICALAIIYGIVIEIVVSRIGQGGGRQG